MKIIVRLFLGLVPVCLAACESVGLKLDLNPVKLEQALLTTVQDEVGSTNCDVQITSEGQAQILEFIRPGAYQLAADRASIRVVNEAHDTARMFASRLLPSGGCPSGGADYVINENTVRTAFSICPIYPFC